MGVQSISGKIAAVILSSSWARDLGSGVPTKDKHCSWLCMGDHNIGVHAI